MHLPSHQLRPKLATVLHRPTDTSTSKAPEYLAPAKTHNSLNIKDKRNIKIGIAALRTVSKWTDKAVLTLEKLEGQDTSKHCQARQARLVAENEGRASGKGTQEAGVWRETVVYPVPARADVSREIEVGDEPKVPSSEAHHAHALMTIVEYHNESSDDEDEGTACRKIDMEDDTETHTDTDGCSSDVSSDEQEEEDSEDENESPQDSDNETDSEEEDSSDDAEDSDKKARTKYPANSDIKK